MGMSWIGIWYIIGFCAKMMAWNMKMVLKAGFGIIFFQYCQLHGFLFTPIFTFWWCENPYFALNAVLEPKLFSKRSFRTYNLL